MHVILVIASNSINVATGMSSRNHFC